MKTDLLSDWLVYVLDPEHKDDYGWTKPLRAVAYGVDRAVKHATRDLPDGSYLVFAVCRDDNEGRHVRVTINRKPSVTVKLV